MKALTLVLIGALTAAAANAESLQKENVSANAKWLLHFDLENLLSTQLGDFIGREFLDKKLAKPARDIQQQFGVEFDWRQIQSLTAYGTDFQKSPEKTAVLIVKSKLRVGESLDSVIDQMATQFADGKAPLRRVQDEPYPLYSANGEVFGSPVRSNLFLLSKSKEQLDKARQVLTGKDPNLTTAKSFGSIPDASGGFLMVAVAEGFSQSAKLPAPARGLKNAESARIVAGEKGDRIFLNLTLDTKDSESATQMQQVVQGLLAMAALNQGENQELQKLVEGTKVSGGDKTVSVNLDLATADVIDKVTQKHAKRKK